MTAALFFFEDLQPDFVDAIPTSVYVTAGKVLIEMPGSIMIKDLAHLAAAAAAADPDLNNYDLFHATHPDFGQGFQARTWRVVSLIGPLGERKNHPPLAKFQ
jgi:hypothetical protein